LIKLKKGENKNMIYITYWELNSDFDPKDLVDLTQTAINKGLVPFEGVKQLAWYVTPDYWGISIEEAESEAAIISNVSMWRIAKPGIFKRVKTCPAMEVAKVLPLIIKIGKKIKG
jgi:hypothetical protein